MDKDEKIKELEEKVQKQGEIITMLEGLLEKLEALYNEKVL